MASPDPDISLVVPSFHRCAALRENLPYLLGLEGLLEVIVVIDRGVDEDTEAMVADEFGQEPRVRLIRAPGNGLSQARNAGCREARGEWIVISDDDLRYPPDYGTTLKRVAAELHADIVGAPWLNITNDDVDEALMAARQRRGGVPTIDDHSVVPERELETPFMPAPALINRRVFDRVTYDENYGNTAWRDETDFFIQAVRMGFKCVLSPATAMYQVEQWEGGARRPRLEYEWSAIRNNWRFLGRHGRWLSEQGYIGTPSGAQVGFVLGRVRMMAAGYTRARVTEAKAALRRSTPAQ
ncbi:MAG: glycosyltransferase [Actinomycetota bacterium]|nr:glycosyltransferase [Actinomycetota bacterium]